ncbi:MAG: hypothetical protein HQL27_08725 [Candidatus Omnitrophica bacterium]|nr:hypothetical protein [Candidatus Omnitrophota bacterium]
MSIDKPLAGKLAFFLTMMLFSLSLFTGFSVAGKRPLWTDEIFTLKASVLNSDYLVIFRGKIREANNNPLFYLIQKGIVDVLHYRSAKDIIAGKEVPQDLYSRLILRINPVVFMSLSVCLIFYFFSRFYSLILGLYSFLISISSYMVWIFWAEARPYSLWLFLTTAQLLLFVRALTAGNYRARCLNTIFLVNVFLSFTASLSIIQIAAVSTTIYLFIGKDWKRFLCNLFIPALIIAYYFLQDHGEYQFWFYNPPLELINASIPKDRFIILAAFIAYFLLNVIRQKRLKAWLDSSSYHWQSTAYLVFTFFVLTGYLLFIAYLKSMESVEKTGFIVPSRYFIPLTSVGIIAMVLFSRSLFNASSNRFYKIIIGLILMALLIFRLYRTSIGADIWQYV